MPVYEFYCPTCNVIRQFFARRPTDAVPDCPACGTRLVRQVSSFQTGLRGDGSDELGDAVLDEATIQRALEAFGPRLQSLTADGDPRASARRIRAFSEAGGLTFNRDVRQLLARLEDGGDPARLAEEFDAMVDAGAVSFAPADRGLTPHTDDPAASAAPSATPLPPPVDPELYTLPTPPLPPRKPNAFSH